MGKAKEKRIRKELDKLLNSGHYWQWLEAVEQEGLFHEHQTQWQEVWQTLARRSFRDPSMMDEFFQRNETLKRKPDLPDVQFLSLLKGFIDGEKDPQELSSLKGLSPAAEWIRKQALLWREEEFPGQRLQKSLEHFISKPELTTRRHYEEVASILQNTPLCPFIQSLGKKISLLVPRSGKSNLRSHRLRLEEIDSSLKQAHTRLPPSLFEILTYPLLYKVDRNVQRLLERGRDDHAFEMASSMPSVFALLAGDQSEAFKARIMALNPARWDPGDFNRILSRGGFEEKISLLGRMRAFHQGGKSEDQYRRGAKALYEAIFMDLKRIYKYLSLQEQRDLGAILARTLMDDVPFICDSIEGDEKDLIDVLRQAGEAMCLEVRLAMLLLILSEKRGEWRLRELAKEFLRNHEKPAREDILWILKHYSWMVLHRIISIRPLLSMWKPEDPLVAEFAGFFWSAAVMALSASSSPRPRGVLSLFFSDMEIEPFRRDLHALRRELLQMREWESFSEISDYLECFPEGSLAEKGYHQFLEMTFKKKGNTDKVVETVERLYATGKALPQITPFFFSHSPDDHNAILEKGFYRFLLEHWQDLKSARMESLERLINFLLAEGFQIQKEHLLFRLGNLLEERVRSGETEAASLKQRVEAFLSRFHYREAKPRRRKRKYQSDEFF